MLRHKLLERYKKGSFETNGAVNSCFPADLSVGLSQIRSSSQLTLEPHYHQQNTRSNT